MYDRDIKTKITFFIPLPDILEKKTKIWYDEKSHNKILQQ